MAISWISALKMVPWSEVIKATPQVVKAAQSMLKKKDAQEEAREHEADARQEDQRLSPPASAGEQALQLGLVDALGSSSYVAREVIGAKDIVDFTREENPFDRFTKKLGASVAERLALWMGFQGPALR